MAAHATSASARARAYPVITAAQAIAQGLTPKAIQSAAAFNERMSTRRGYEHAAGISRRLRTLAREVDQATGYYARFRGLARPANDNRRSRRAAA